MKNKNQSSFIFLLLMGYGCHLLGSQTLLLPGNVFTKTFCKKAAFSKVKAGQMFGGGQLPSIIPESKYNEMFKDPIENTHKVLVAILAKTSCDMNLEFVSDSFIKDKCEVCNKSLEDILSNKESCFKTQFNAFLHKDCATRGNNLKANITISEIRPLLKTIGNLYEILQVEATASNNEIIESYNAAKSLVKNDQSQTFLLEEAFAILSDDNLRHQYDSLLGIKKEKTLLVSLCKAEESIVVTQFSVLVDSIAFLYKNRKALMAKIFKLDEKLTYFESNAKIFGFEYFLDKVILPASKESDVAQAIIRNANRLSFKEKLQFLCAWISGSMEFSQSEESVCLALKV